MSDKEKKLEKVKKSPLITTEVFDLYEKDLRRLIREHEKREGEKLKKKIKYYYMEREKLLEEYRSLSSDLPDLLF